MSVKYVSTDRLWFALGFDGALYALGDCGDYEAAGEVATDLGIDSFWLVDPEQAHQWYSRLSLDLGGAHTHIRRHYV